MVFCGLVGRGVVLFCWVCFVGCVLGLLLRGLFCAVGVVGFGVF